jgi:hypothetical protein
MTTKFCLTPVFACAVVLSTGSEALATTPPDKRIVPALNAICDMTTMKVKPELLARHLLADTR